jgi:hypothetical protein
MRKSIPKRSEPDPTEIMPTYSADLMTAHPVGLVVVFGVLLMSLIALPEARWFVGGALLLGVIFGFVLWIRHRGNPVWKGSADNAGASNGSPFICVKN